MRSAHLERLRQTFAGQMTDGEVIFSNDARALVRATLEGRVHFNSATSKLLEDLKFIRCHKYDVDAALAVRSPTAAAGALQAASASGTHSLSDRQRAFLMDVDGYLDFASRNGLTFMFVLQGLMHDLNEL